ncbi:DUF1203 domain-containing protein [Aeromonas rivuli]|uniref:DUF1203 domain-containing protein n=1 Tax=Aeromonas rivuli TaxID=648794 RepID=UPI0005A93D18|nr:DUF1203 domain-containing protein [Aeromonas rivuli]
MNTNFIIQALDKNLFARAMGMNDKELEAVNARWLIADASPGYPCRVSLREACVGERVLLIHFPHHDVSSPYRACGPVFVREHAKTAMLDTNEIPEILPGRLLSIRAYDSSQMMIHAQTIQGTEFEQAVRNQFLNERVSYLQIHNANPGCFSCAVYRA